MTLREVAHAAQQHLQTQAPAGAVKRSHVHELLAATFGAQSWAAFLSNSLLADAGAGDAPTAEVAHVAGRALQLGYAQPAAVRMAGALLAFAAERQLSRVRWSAIMEMLASGLGGREEEALSDEVAEPSDAEEAEIDVQRLLRDRLLRSPLLLDGLDHASTGLSARRHHGLAALYRRKRPDPYLYQESLKGRALNPVERAWVDDYLRAEPIFSRYQQHLRAAALGGERSAALEYASVFEDPEFFALAERLTGDIDAERMAQLAPTGEARERWLRTAADQGLESALWHLAEDGDLSALERLAGHGDVRAMRSAVELALERQDALRAWTWQYVASLHGTDFAKSTLQAYHDGGSRHGEFYDSDFGGAVFVDGEEALTLPVIDDAHHRRARALAQRIYEGAPPENV